MPGAGTDKTKSWVVQPGPCVILVEPQLADNIGSVARAMANFGLSELRLVSPRQGWPHERAIVMAGAAAGCRVRRLHAGRQSASTGSGMAERKTLSGS